MNQPKIEKKIRTPSKIQRGLFPINSKFTVQGLAVHFYKDVDMDWQSVGDGNNGDGYVKMVLIT